MKSMIVSFIDQNVETVISMSNQKKKSISLWKNKYGSHVLYQQKLQWCILDYIPK